MCKRHNAVLSASMGFKWVKVTLARVGVRWVDLQRALQTTGPMGNPACFAYLLWEGAKTASS